MKEIKITPPEGYIIDKDNSTFERIVFKKIKIKYPSKWEDLEENNNIEYFLGDCSTVSETDDFISNEYCKNQWTKKEYAEALLALCQLVRLRDIYNDGVEIDWDKTNIPKWYINFDYEKINKGANYGQIRKVLTFHKEKQRDLFLENYRDLIEIAKFLL